MKEVERGRGREEEGCMYGHSKKRYILYMYCTSRTLCIMVHVILSRQKQMHIQRRGVNWMGHYVLQSCFTN